MTTMLTVNWKYTAILTALALSMAAARADAADLVWDNNSGDLTWNTTSANWGDGVTLFTNGDDVTFGPVSPAANQTITVTTGLEPGSVTFNSPNQYAMNSNGWGGTGTLTKNGTGNLVIGAISTFTGGTIINQGTVFVNSSSNGNGGLLGPAGSQNITVNSGGILNGRRSNFSGTLTFNGGTWKEDNGFGGSWTGPVILGADSTVDSFRNLAINGSISGTGGIIKKNNGHATVGAILTLNGIHTYTGDTFINGLGTIILPDNASLLFDIGAAGVNNQIVGTGPGIVNLHGDFTFDLTDAGKEMNDTWNIVDLASLTVTFGPTFSVNDFDEISDGEWARLVGGTTYTFSESTGLLVATPEPSTLVMLGLAGLGLVGLGLYRRRRSA